MQTQFSSLAGGPEFSPERPRPAGVPCAAVPAFPESSRLLKSKLAIRFRSVLSCGVTKEEKESLRTLSLFLSPGK